MNRSPKLAPAAVAAALAMCFGAPLYAADSGSNSMQSSPQVKHGTAAATPNATTGGSYSNDMQSWSSQQAAQNQGRISRDAYMNEAGRRFDELDASKRGNMTRQQYLDDLGGQWDAMDTSHRGLTPAEVGRLTGKVDIDHAGPARTGSGVQAGNMGPGNAKAQ